MLIETIVACALLHPAPGIAVGPDDTIYLADGPAHRIWELRLGEPPVVFAEGEDGSDLSVPHHLHVDDEGRLYVAGDRTGRVLRFDADGTRTVLGASIRVPPGGAPFTIGPDGGVVTFEETDDDRTVLVRHDESGTRVLTGGRVGWRDGADALFGPLHGSTLATAGEVILIADDGRMVRRMIEGVTATLAGDLERGFADGNAARFDGPLGLHADGDAIMVADQGNHRVRRIERGVTTTFAGTGQRGGDDGAPLQATFDHPIGIERLSDGSWIIVERPTSHRMRVRRMNEFHVLTVCEIDASTDPGPIPEAPATFMGRRAARTMHYAGAPWLVRESREREEDTKTFLETLDIEPGDVVCDIGCGNGFYALPIADLVGPEGVVVGLDIQPEMLDLLHLRAIDAGIDNVRPHLGTIIDPRLEPDSIDLMIAVDVYHEFSHPEQMMDHLREALRDDGRFVLLEFRQEDPRVPIKPLHKMSKAHMVSEMDAHGFVVDSEFDGLPWQHMVTFRKR